MMDLVTFMNWIQKANRIYISKTAHVASLNKTKLKSIYIQIQTKHQHI